MSEKRIEHMKLVQSEALELFITKNTDYGDTFATYGTVGLGIIVRIGDSIQRILTLSSKKLSLSSETEILREYLFDLQNYAAMGIILFDEEREKREKNIAEPKN